MLRKTTMVPSVLCSIAIIEVTCARTRAVPPSQVVAQHKPQRGSATRAAAGVVAAAGGGSDQHGGEQQRDRAAPAQRVAQRADAYRRRARGHGESGEAHLDAHQCHRQRERLHSELVEDGHARRGEHVEDASDEQVGGVRSSHRGTARSPLRARPHDARAVAPRGRTQQKVYRAARESGGARHYCLVRNSV